MKKLNLALMVSLIALSACGTKKPLPKLCTVTIDDPEKTTYKSSSGCIKRKTLWRQLGIEK